MNCKICSQKTEKIFTCEVLVKYNVKYYRCTNCLFIQTEEPFWLDESYSSGAICALDVGIISRNILLANRAKEILGKIFLNFNSFYGLDYGGGQGIFVRMMRDLGYNFYRQDMYAENVYAQYFDINDSPSIAKFDILTAFEVFEHLPNPMVEIQKMLNYSDILLFSTELQPSEKISEIENWWYVIPETGQHISFYNKITLQEIARIFKVHYYTDSVNIHILSRNALPIDPFQRYKNEIKKNIIQRIINKLNVKLNGIKPVQSIFGQPKSLTMTDFYFIKRKIGTK